MIARAGGLGFDTLPLTSADPIVTGNAPLLVGLAPPAVLSDEPGVVVPGEPAEGSVGGSIVVVGGGGGGAGLNSKINVSMRVEHPKDVSAPSVPSQ